MLSFYKEQQKKKKKEIRRRRIISRRTAVGNAAALSALISITKTLYCYFYRGFQLGGSWHSLKFLGAN